MYIYTECIDIFLKRFHNIRINFDEDFVFVNDTIKLTVSKLFHFFVNKLLFLLVGACRRSGVLDFPSRAIAFTTSNNLLIINKLCARSGSRSMAVDYRNTQDFRFVR